MFKDNFDQEELHSSYESLGIPISAEWVNNKVRPGYLRISGHALEATNGDLNIVGQKVNENHFTVSAKLDFYPKNNQQKAGLVTCFNSSQIYFLHILGISELGKMHIKICSIEDGTSDEIITQPIDFSSTNWVQLKISFEEGKLLFYYSIEKYRWHKLGPTIQERSISKNQDIRSEEILVGMGVQGPQDLETHADFEYFKYDPHN